MGLSRIIVGIVLLGCGCASTSVLSPQPKENDRAKINLASKDHWVRVTCIDRSEYEGTHFAMNDSSIDLTIGGNRLWEKEGTDQATIPIGIIANITIEHRLATRAFLYPAAGFVLGLLIGVDTHSDGDEAATFLILIGLGTGIGLVVGVGDFLFATIPDWVSDRPTFYLQSAHDSIPIFVDTVDVH